MNSDIMVYSKSVKTDMEKGGLIKELIFRVNDTEYIVKRIDGVYRISSGQKMFDETVKEDFFRDVDLAMKAYSVTSDETEKPKVDGESN